MATYIETWNLRFVSSNLKCRTAVAVAKAAQDIINESPATTNHANRVIWAKEALLDCMAKAEQMLWPVVSNATIASAGESATDSDIQFVVNSNIDSFATGS